MSTGSQASAQRGKLSDLLKLWEHLAEYTDELLELIPLLKELRTNPTIAGKANAVAAIARLFTDEIPGDIDDRAVELVEEFLKHPELVEKTQALLRAIGILKSGLTKTEAPNG